MARLYADEHFPYPVVELLRGLGHDVLTVQDAGNDRDWEALANRIDAAIAEAEPLTGKLVRVVRPSR